MTLQVDASRAHAQRACRARSANPVILLHVAVAALYGARRCGCAGRAPRAARPPRTGLRRRWRSSLHAVTHRARRSFTPDGLDLSFPQRAVAGRVAHGARRVAVRAARASCRRSATVVLPVAARVRAGAACAASTPHRFAYAGETWAAVHIAVALRGLRAVRRRGAAGAGADRAREARLHSGLAAPDADGAPPLLTLERFLFRLVGAGLRAAHARRWSAASCSPRKLFGKPLTFTHKNVFSVAGLARRSACCCSAAGATAGAAGTALRWILAGTAAARARLPRQQVRRRGAARAAECTHGALRPLDDIPAYARSAHRAGRAARCCRRSSRSPRRR